MEQHWNARAGETGDPRENPPTRGNVRHDSHLRKYRVRGRGLNTIRLAQTIPTEEHRNVHQALRNLST
ncbi:hypothetical protein PR048_013850 [Dryococelus australis]|uniref:Uncharacterized protein n=1 Tax=Dryococelus australis TaxID=614101 RepID=A0ABQ9HTS6_9NEOP|nr:hypothetical protein PR048_013850 [Dryococelus australis]